MVALQAEEVLLVVPTVVDSGAATLVEAVPVPTGKENNERTQKEEG